MCMIIFLDLCSPNNDSWPHGIHYVFFTTHIMVMVQKFAHDASVSHHSWTVMFPLYEVQRIQLLYSRVTCHFYIMLWYVECHLELCYAQQMVQLILLFKHFVVYIDDL